MDGTALGLLLTKTIAAILLRLLEVIPKPLKNAVYGTENRDEHSKESQLSEV